MPPLHAAPPRPQDAATTAPGAARSALPARGRILAAEVERMRLTMLRYPTEAIAGLFVFGFMFMVFAVIGRLTQGMFTLFSGNMQSLAALYALWVMVSTTVAGGATQIGGDAAIGMLETLFLSAAPVTRILQMRALASLIQGGAMGLLLFLIFCIGTQWLPSATSLLALAVAALSFGITSVGLSMAFCGLALLSKRVSTLMLPINFLCIVAVMGHHAAAMRLDDPVLYLPFIAGASAVRAAIEQGGLDLRLGLVAPLAACAYLWCGRLVLRRCSLACRRTGTTNVY